MRYAVRALGLLALALDEDGLVLRLLALLVVTLQGAGGELGLLGLVLALEDVSLGLALLELVRADVLPQLRELRGHRLHLLAGELGVGLGVHRAHDLLAVPVAEHQVGGARALGGLDGHATFLLSLSSGNGRGMGASASVRWACRGPKTSFQHPTGIVLAIYSSWLAGARRVPVRSGRPRPHVRSLRGSRQGSRSGLAVSSRALMRTLGIVCRLELKKCAARNLRRRAERGKRPVRKSASRRRCAPAVTRDSSESGKFAGLRTTRASQVRRKAVANPLGEASSGACRRAGKCASATQIRFSPSGKSRVRAE